MDLNIFTLVLVPSMRELLQTTDRDLVLQAGSIVIAVKFLCWGVGGVFFGVIADRFGRARTLVATILIYAVFTGLSGLARSWEELLGLQAIAGNSGPGKSTIDKLCAPTVREGRRLRLIILWPSASLPAPGRD